MDSTVAAVLVVAVSMVASLLFELSLWFLGSACAALAVFFTWLGRERARSQVAALGAPDVDAVLDELAGAVRHQWRAEAARRRLGHPSSFTLRWRLARDLSLMDRPGDVFGGHAPGRWWLFDPSGGEGDIGEAFMQLPYGRLIIIGEAGSGKSALAIRLTEQLLNGPARERRQVPVLVPIASWNPRQQEWASWLAAQLAYEHRSLGEYTPFGVTLARHLVDLGHVMPILDGFDEMAPHLRADAIRALNGALTARDPVVLTSRIEEYRLAVSEVDSGPGGSGPSCRILDNAAVIEVQPLEMDDVVRYLLGVAAEPKRAALEPVIRNLCTAPDGPLAQVLTRPLMATLVRFAYLETRRDPAELLDERFSVADDIAGHLLDQIIPTAPSVEPSRDGTGSVDRIRRLQRLAHLLDQRQMTEIAWWEFHRLVPAAVMRIVVWLTSAVFAGTLVAVAGMAMRIVVRAGRVIYHREPRPSFPSGMLSWLSHGTEFWLRWAFVAGFIVALPWAVLTRVPQPRRLTPLRARAWRLFSYPLSYAALAAGTVELIRMANHRPLGSEVMFGIGIGTFVGVSRVVSGWTIRHPDMEAPDSATAQRDDRRAAIGKGVLVGLLAGLVSWVMTASVLWAHTSVKTRWTTALTLLWCALLVCTVHTWTRSSWGWSVAARCYLSATRQRPWHLDGFLEDEYRMDVLRRSGAAYQFRHVELQHRLTYQFTEAGLRRRSRFYGRFPGRSGSRSR